MKLTKKQCLQDERILAAILAGAAACGREVLPAYSHDGVCGSGNGFGLRPYRNADGPCCAVGAGVLYAGISESRDPCVTFAEMYGVSELYASAVSSAFEIRYEYDFVNRNLDTKRGAEVGRAAFQILCLDGAGA